MIGGLLHQVGKLPRGQARNRAIVASVVICLGVSSVYNYALVKMYGRDIPGSMTPEWLEAQKKYRKFQNMDPPELTGRDY